MQRLSSWKEIADYLGVTVRTAQNWEQERGLPVHRIPGARGPVYALADELDKWMASEKSPRQEKDVHPLEPSVPQVAFSAPADPLASTPHRHHLAAVIVASTILLLATIGLVLASKTQTRGKPFSYKVEDKQLVVLDNQKQVLWRRDFAFPLRSWDYGLDHKKVWFGDLEGDGTVEVLFVVRDLSEQFGGSSLYCFSESGEIKWIYTPGRRVHIGNEEYDPPFDVAHFKVAKTAEGTRIVTVNTHYLYFPTQVAVLDPDGKMLSDYWHAGHFQQMEIADLDGDKKPEIYLAGINNDYKAGTFVVLDIENVRGASDEPGADYRFNGVPSAQERARLIFPPTCFTKKLEPFNEVSQITFNDGGITLGVTQGFVGSRRGTTIMYDLDRSLHVRSISPTSAFLAAHKEMEAQKLLDHHWSDKEMAELRNIRYLTPKQ